MTQPTIDCSKSKNKYYFTIKQNKKKKKKPKEESQKGKIGEGGREDKKVERGSQISMEGRRRMKDGEGGSGIMK